MQDDLLQPFLTVEESMQIAAKLKLGKELSHEQKLQVVSIFIIFFLDTLTLSTFLISNSTYIYLSILSKSLK